MAWEQVRPWLWPSAAYVVGSSVFGLLPLVLEDGLGNFFGVWGESVVADLIFTGGTVAAGGLTMRARERANIVVGLLVGFAANWAVYAFSFMLVMDVSPLNPGNWGEAFGATVSVGCLGLVFAAVGPVVFTKWARRRSVEVPMTAGD